MNASILITGGAGYIGSHMVLAAASAGFTPVILDDFSTGHMDAITQGVAVSGNIADRALLRSILAEHSPACIMHFAAKSLVAESVEKPELYWKNNVEDAAILMEAAAEAKIPFIFSSTAAVYGMPEYTPMDEAHPTAPINPYGETKLAAERKLEEYRLSHGLNYGILRYFNAAGAAPGGVIGERHEPETHLIPLAIRAAMHGTEMKIFGDDYDTQDGTCLRDYIHVLDLCDAHLRLYNYIQTLRPSQPASERIFNLGTGTGFSVREVIETTAKITGKTIHAITHPRRAGDPPALVANGSRAKNILGWKPKHSDLATIIEDAFRFHQNERIS